MQIYKFFHCLPPLVLCPTIPAALTPHTLLLCLTWEDFLCSIGVFFLYHHLKVPSGRKLSLSRTYFIYLHGFTLNNSVSENNTCIFFRFLAVYGEKGVVLVNNGCYHFLNNLFTYLEIFLDFQFVYLSTQALKVWL